MRDKFMREVKNINAKNRHLYCPVQLFVLACSLENISRTFSAVYRKNVEKKISEKRKQKAQELSF